jgi:hypothetical protein
VADDTSEKAIEKLFREVAVQLAVFNRQRKHVGDEGVGLVDDHLRRACPSIAHASPSTHAHPCHAQHIPRAGSRCSAVSLSVPDVPARYPVCTRRACPLPCMHSVLVTCLPATLYALSAGQRVSCLTRRPKGHCNTRAQQNVTGGVEPRRGETREQARQQRATTATRQCLRARGRGG